MGAVLRVEGLVRRYRTPGRTPVTALQGVSFHVAAGEAVALLGPNGSGKSTTLRLCVGLEAPTAGRVELFGRPPAERSVRRRLGFLPEETSLFPFLSGRETLDLLGRCHGLPRRERRRRGEAWLARVGLADAARRRVGTYSRGMARRLGLAVAFYAEPELLVLDEPTAGLDPEGASLALELVRQRVAAGGAALFTTHVLDETQAAERWLLLVAGRIAAAGVRREAPLRRWVTVAGLPAAALPELERFVRAAGGRILPGPALPRTAPWSPGPAEGP